MIYAYKMGSKSATALAAALGKKKIKHTQSKFKGGGNKLVINWGAKNLPEEINKCQVVNKPHAVGIASNKLTFFQTAEKQGGINIPEYTTEYDVAKEWSHDGNVVVVRELLTGSSGHGIVVLGSPNEFDHYEAKAAKMYVKYIPKKDEFRVHVLGDVIVDVRRKALSPKIDQAIQKVNWKIRNHDNGFIFVKTNPEDYDEQVLDQAVKAVKACGLDFGAVDIIWNKHRNKAYVLEINTAPGLEGSSVDNYKKGFEALYKELPFWLNDDPNKEFDINKLINKEKAGKYFADVKPMHFEKHWKFIHHDEEIIIDDNF